MNEGTISNSDIQEWVNTLNGTDDRVQKVLGAIQLLDGNLLQQLVYFLINGVFDISDLYTMNINNTTIRNKLAIYDINDNKTAIIQYKNKIKTFTSYTNFINEMNGKTADRFTIASLSPFRIAVSKTIDPLGITDGSVSSVTVLMAAYNQIINDASLITLQNSIVSQAAAIQTKYNYKRLNNLVTNFFKKIADYYFIFTNDNSLGLKINYTDLEFYIAKGGFKQVKYTRFIENFMSALNGMALYYGADETKDGSYAVNQLKNNVSFGSSFTDTTILSSSLFENQFNYTTFVRMNLYSTIYGSAFFNDISTVKEEFDSIISLFDNMYNYCTIIRTACKGVGV
jgi:hypothetical protein